MIISKTPFRISLFGGGSDHPAWFSENGGAVVSFSINKYCFITVRKLPPFFDHSFRIAYSQIETVNHFSEIRHPVVRECIRKYLPISGLEIHHDGDLPARSGIGSSSAFVVGIINSLLALKGHDLPQRELANHAILMEKEILRENVGWQDQIACSIGGFNLIRFSQEGVWNNQQIVLPKTTEDELCSRIVLTYTGISRNSTDITSGLIDSIQSKSRQILRMMEMVSEFAKILESGGDLDIVGQMLNEAWELKKSTNILTTTTPINDIYKRGILAGALGGKILGAGGGGFMLFWVKKDGREEFLRKFGKATVVPISICHSGSKIIYRDNELDRNYFSE